MLTLVHVEHRLEQARVVDHDVVAEEHRERFVADVLACDRHRMTEAERIALADVVDVGDVVDDLDVGELVELPGLLEVVLELEVAIEVVFDGVLPAPGDDEDVAQTRRRPLPRRRTGSTACRRRATSPSVGSS